MTRALIILFIALAGVVTLETGVDLWRALR
jgi:hypothetical protein